MLLTPLVVNVDDLLDDFDVLNLTARINYKSNSLTLNLSCWSLRIASGLPPSSARNEEISRTILQEIIVTRRKGFKVARSILAYLAANENCKATVENILRKACVLKK